MGIWGCALVGGGGGCCACCWPSCSPCALALGVPKTNGNLIFAMFFAAGWAILRDPKFQHFLGQIFCFAIFRADLNTFCPHTSFSQIYLFLPPKPKISQQPGRQQQQQDTPKSHRQKSLKEFMDSPDIKAGSRPTAQVNKDPESRSDAVNHGTPG